MVVVWIDHIANKLDKEVTIRHSDKWFHPVVNGEKYDDDKPLTLKPGFNEDVDWFVVPWIDCGKMIIDINKPFTVAIAGAEPSEEKPPEDWLQIFSTWPPPDGEAETFKPHWKQMGERTVWWNPLTFGHVHLSLTFSKDSPGGQSKKPVTRRPSWNPADWFGADIDMVHFDQTKKDGEKKTEQEEAFAKAAAAEGAAAAGVAAAAAGGAAAAAAPKFQPKARPAQPAKDAKADSSGSDDAPPPERKPSKGKGKRKPSNDDAPPPERKPSKGKGKDK